MYTKISKKATAAAAARTPEAASALKELFVDELKDIYWAEKHLASALPKLIKGATSEDLKQTIMTHLEETKNQITRLLRTVLSPEKIIPTQVRITHN